MPSVVNLGQNAVGYQNRNVLFAYLEPILQNHDITVQNFVELLVYGHTSLNESVNKNILLATLDFITKTKRFA